MGVGIHPTAAFADVIYRQTLHRNVADDVRGLLRQSPFCGTHIHVGMPDPETATACAAGSRCCRRWAPTPPSGTAWTPAWPARARWSATALPRTGTPRAFRDWDDCAATMQELVRVGELDGLGSLWWDMRPHPLLGTLEIRAIDAQSSLDDLVGLIALVHCLALHEALTAGDEHPSRELLDEASFRAVRDGVNATYSVGGPLRHVERILAEGNGATRQRRAFEAGGMPAVLELLAAESRGADTAAGTVAA